MSHFTCPGCGVTIADRNGTHVERTCPRCFLHRGMVVRMEPSTLSESVDAVVAEAQAELARIRAAAAETRLRLRS